MPEGEDPPAGGLVVAQLDRVLDPAASGQRDPLAGLAPQINGELPPDQRYVAEAERSGQLHALFLRDAALELVLDRDSRAGGNGGKRVLPHPAGEQRNPAKLEKVTLGGAPL